MSPMRGRLRLIAVLALLTGLTLVYLALLAPAAAGSASGCSREPGSPSISGGQPDCEGPDTGCYYCEYSNPDGGYTICSETPDPEEEPPNCVDTPTLPGRHPLNQT